jgi:hypothetical protein
MLRSFSRLWGGSNVRNSTKWQIEQELQRLAQFGPQWQLVGEPGSWQLRSSGGRLIGTPTKDLATICQRLNAAIVSAIESELSALS